MQWHENKERFTDMKRGRERERERKLARDAMA